MGVVDRKANRRHILALMATVTLAAGLAPLPSEALDGDAHRLISVGALKELIDTDFLMSPTEAELVKFYQWFGQAMAGGGDPDLQARFRGMFPDPTDFDATGVRLFLGFNQDPNVSVTNIGTVKVTNAEQRLNVLVGGAIAPLEDGRLRNYGVYDKESKLLKNDAGEPIPFDPITLRLAPLLGPGSDLWGRFAAATAAPDAVTELDDPRPEWRVPLYDPAPINYAALLAEAHLSMAVLARIWTEMTFDVTGDYLAAAYVGSTMHFVQTASSPLMVSEVAAPVVRQKAGAAYTADALRTVGGYLGALEPAAARIRRARISLTALGDKWLRDQLGQAELGKDAHPLIKAALGQLAADDDTLRKMLRARLMPWLNGPGYTEPIVGGRGGATVLVEALAAISARDSEAAFEALATMADDAVVRGDLMLPTVDEVQPEHWRDAKTAEYQAAEQVFAELTARSMVRAATASRLVTQLFRNGNPDSAARRLEMSRMAFLQGAEERRASWVTGSYRDLEPVRSRKWAVGGVGGALVLLLLIAFAVARLGRRSS